MTVPQRLTRLTQHAREQAVLGNYDASLSNYEQVLSLLQEQLNGNFRGGINEKLVKCRAELGEEASLVRQLEQTWAGTKPLANNKNIENKIIEPSANINNRNCCDDTKQQPNYFADNVIFNKKNNVLTTPKNNNTGGGSSSSTAVVVPPPKNSFLDGFLNHDRNAQVRQNNFSGSKESNNSSTNSNNFGTKFFSEENYIKTKFYNIILKYGGLDTKKKLFKKKTNWLNIIKVVKFNFYKK